MKTKAPRPSSRTLRQPARVLAPERPDPSIRFTLSGFPAQAVFLAGDFNGWSPAALPLRGDGAGTWSAEVELPPGSHEYLFVVDGVWQPDPAAAQSVPNPFGGRNSVVQVESLSSLS